MFYTEKMDNKQIKQHQELINKIGTAVLMDMFHISKGAISQWRNNGIPKVRLMYLELSHPELFVTPQKSKSSKQPRKEKR